MYKLKLIKIIPNLKKYNSNLSNCCVCGTHTNDCVKLLICEYNLSSVGALNGQVYRLMFCCNEHYLQFKNLLPDIVRMIPEYSNLRALLERERKLYYAHIKQVETVEETKEEIVFKNLNELVDYLTL